MNAQRVQSKERDRFQQAKVNERDEIVSTSSRQEESASWLDRVTFFSIFSLLNKMGKQDQEREERVARMVINSPSTKSGCSAQKTGKYTGCHFPFFSIFLGGFYLFYAEFISHEINIESDFVAVDYSSFERPFRHAIECYDAVKIQFLPLNSLDSFLLKRCDTADPEDISLTTVKCSKGSRKKW